MMVTDTQRIYSLLKLLDKAMIDIIAELDTWNDKKIKKLALDLFVKSLDVSDEFAKAVKTAIAIRLVVK